MKVDVRMPKLGESITEGTIVKWWKKPGEHVAKEETLLEISTDKVDSEIPSPHEGKVVELKAEESETVEVDSVIAVIETEGAAGEDEEDRGGSDEKTAEKETKKEEKEDKVEKEQKEAPEKGEEAEKEAETAAKGDAEKKAKTSSGGGNIVEVEMPKLGESITEGTIVKWWKKPGDTVKKDETLLEISTDKVDSEIPSPYEGKIKELLADENDVVEVGNPIARIQTGEGGAEAEKSQKAAEPSEDGRRTAEKEAETEEKTAKDAEEQEPVKREKGGRFYSPLVRMIARKEGIAMRELEKIPGSGVEGRVTKKDVLDYLESGRVAPEEAAKPSREAAPKETRPEPKRQERPELPTTGEVEEKWEGKRVDVIPMDNIRQKIADHMVKSKHTSPHVYGVAEVDFTAVMTLVRKNREAFKGREDFKLTVNPLILLAVVKALKDFPGVNSSIEGNNIVQKRFINIGIAVATDRGLIVPVLKNADELNFVGLARNAYDLAIRARNKKLTIEDIQGSTFTVTNYGVFGNVIGFPIINQPNVAILGVGAVKKRPVVLETETGDMIGVREIGFLTLSYDHRVVDGELGDKFLQRVRHYLENFQEDWM